MTVDGSNPVFMLYKNGVLDDNACGTEINHAVTAVGYGSENGKLFYIVRNEWGVGWGEQGYVRIAIEDGIGMCGIQ